MASALVNVIAPRCRDLHGLGMFGVASNFRKTHGEAAFRMLASTAFAGADTDRSGKIDTSELNATLKKLGMNVTEAQTMEIVREYDADGNHEHFRVL